MRGALLTAVTVLVAASASPSVGSSLPASASSSSSSSPFREGSTRAVSSSARPGQYGKFLHITDLHPDAHYFEGAKISHSCHVSRKKDKKRHGGKFPPKSSLSSALPGASSVSNLVPALIVQAVEHWLPTRLWSPAFSSKKKKKHKGKHGKKRAGHFGAPGSACDSPPALVSASLQWVADNWLSQSRSTSRSTQDIPGQQHQLLLQDEEDGLGFDFILVTGDLARHDVDASHYPRTLPEIYESNRWAMDQIESHFPGVPIVPCVGNNDIFPHNLMWPGPSPITRELSNIWAKHIPEFEQHNFQRGAYFAKEVIPNELAVLSLNTIYMYDSNKVVDGCVKSKKGSAEKDRDVGTVMLDWMEVQLSLFRSRSMQVHIMGHVPPTAGNYFPLCYERYTDIVLRYQDTVVGQHFGHMNVDAFFVQEDEEAVSSFNVTTDASAETQVVGTSKHHKVHVTSLADDLQADYATLPGRNRANLDYYHAYFAAPSIVPTFLPTIRVFTYNTTKDAKYTPSQAQADLSYRALINDTDTDEDDDEEDENLVEDDIRTKGRSHRRRHRKHKKKKHHKKKLPRYASPDSPARTNTYLSMLGYSQWVLDLDRANEEWANATAAENRKGKIEFALEYATYEPETLWSPYLSEMENKDREGRGSHTPVPKHLLDRQLSRIGVEPPRYFQQGSSPRPLAKSLSRLRPASDNAAGPDVHSSAKLRLPKAIKHMTDYSMESLTVEPMMELARRLASDKKLWKRFTGRMYQGLPGGK
ncbi:Endopolyphosphatase [Tilletia horrida]|uniref:Endopolyphosphatase n=1 Tax=Tilletia horrida TaxID=155126 RepID=A0AAN6GM19_9BASI|nr:Endopolyphosphatase [Tilletia horrida]